MREFLSGEIRVPVRRESTTVRVRDEQEGRMNLDLR